MASTQPTSISARLIRLAKEPDRLERVLRGYYNVHRFRRLATRSKPVPVPSQSNVEVHQLFGHRGVLNAIATLKSLYRFLPEPYALVVHEDGTLTSADWGLVTSHFPGARLIPRRTADEDVTAELRRRDLPRCAKLRKELIFALKLFDLQFYGRERSVLYIDTDILFLREPTELVAALSRAPEHWVDRYNEDFASGYAWSAEEIFEHVGVQMLPCVNAGMLAVRRDELDWEFYERCLAIPNVQHHYYLEQTLNAIDISRRGGRPLPPDYDVAFRHTCPANDSEWLLRAPRGHEVVTQHYCGSLLHASHYFEHFVRHVAPTLA